MARDRAAGPSQGRQQFGADAARTLVLGFQQVDRHDRAWRYLGALAEGPEPVLDDAQEQVESLSSLLNRFLIEDLFEVTLSGVRLEWPGADETEMVFGRGARRRTHDARTRRDAFDRRRVRVEPPALRPGGERPDEVRKSTGETPTRAGTFAGRALGFGTARQGENRPCRGGIPRSVRSASPLSGEPQSSLVNYPDSADALSLECSVHQHLPHTPRGHLEFLGRLFHSPQGHEQKSTKNRSVLHTHA